MGRRNHLCGPRLSMEDNIKTNLKETECEGMERIRLAHDRFQSWAFVNTVTNITVSKSVSQRGSYVY
jgi:hypothetical protein